MDREFVLLLLALAVGGPALLCLGWLRANLPLLESGQESERHAWLQLWIPLVPGALVIAMLLGWALLEPDNAESVPWPVAFAALPFATLLVRALVRAVRALLRDPGDGPAVTVGLLRPRVTFSPRLVARLDPAALSAAEQHELAHARHLDPLRIWLAQLATDLMWPWPAASRRFRQWLHALELARDEEARMAGAHGEDLAAAIVAAAQLRVGRSPASTLVAGLLGNEAALKERVRRLLEPMHSTSTKPRRPFLLLLVGVALGIAIAFGAILGEATVRAVLGAAP